MSCELDKVISIINEVANGIKNPAALKELNELKSEINNKYPNIDVVVKPTDLSAKGEIEDLYQIGCIGFIKSIKRFDTKFEVKLSTYSVPYILGEIKRFIRDDGPIKVSRSIKELNVKNYPIIFMGDFNSEPSEERIVNLSNIMNDSRIVSIEKPFGPSGTFNNFEHNKPVTQLIDYIFISKNPGFVVKKYAVLSDSKDLKYPSDHLPVFVELILKK